MSKLTESDLHKIANLAQLSIPEKGLPELMTDLDNILDLVKKMDRVDTSLTMPLAHPLNVSQPLREDQITETDQRELFQQNAPKVEAGLYIVPQFVETE